MYRQADDIAGSDADFPCASQLQVRQAGGFEHVDVVALVFVHDFQAVHVLDPALGVFTVQDTVLADIEAHQRTHHESAGEQGDHGQQDDRIANQARAQHVGLLPREVVLGGIADQAFGVVHLIHDGVTGVDAGGAADAFDLQAVTDVDAGRANLDAHGAVDAVTQAFGLVIEVFLAWATGFAATWVVGNDQGVFVEHDTLEAGIRAHVHAHLLTQPAGVAVGGEGEEADPEIRPAIGLASEELHHQLADRREVADEGHAGDKADQ
ncbi:hypothetical protein D3C81_1009980 [compost metagenome]